jgi:MFS family permease
MSDDIILKHIHTNIKYQSTLIIIGCMIWGFSDIISLSLGLLEIKPEVEVFKNDTMIYKGYLDYKYCNQNYTITHMNQHSLVNYFGVYCDKYLVALIGSFNFLGVFLGTIVSPFIFDTYGRRLPIVVCCFLNSAILIISTFVWNIYQMYICVLLYGFTNLISHISIFLIINEVTSKGRRAFYSMIIFNSFALFGMIFTLEFQYFQDWKVVFRLDFICTTIVAVLATIFVKESPRYLLLCNDAHFKDKMLKKIFNYGKESDYLVKLLKERNLHGRELSHYELRQELLELDHHTHHHRKPKPAITLIKNPSIRYIFLIMCFMWFCISGTYYAISILLKDISGNIYLVYTLMYLFEIISNICSALLMENSYFGRKKSMTYLYTIAVLFSVAISVLDKKYFQAFAMIALRFGISMIYNINYVYSTEFYPTDIRAKGFAFNALFGRLGGIVIPFVVEVMGFYYFLASALAFVICFIFSFFIQETFDTELQQYIN